MTSGSDDCVLGEEHRQPDTEQPFNCRHFRNIPNKVKLHLGDRTCDNRENKDESDRQG